MVSRAPIVHYPGVQEPVLPDSLSPERAGPDKFHLPPAIPKRRLPFYPRAHLNDLLNLPELHPAQIDTWWQPEVRPRRIPAAPRRIYPSDALTETTTGVPDVTTWWQPAVRPPLGGVRGRIADLVAASPFGELVEVVTLDKWWQPQVIPRRLPARYQIHPDIMTRGSFEAVIVPAPDISTWWQPQVIPKRRPLFLLRPQNYSGVVIIEDVFGVPQNATRLLLVI